jgi:hypothetical protein
MHQPDRTCTHDEFRFAGSDAEHLLPTQYAGKRFHKRGCLETCAFVLNGVDVLLGDNGELFVSAVRELGIGALVWAPAATIDAETAFDDKVGHDALADLKAVDAFSDLDDHAAGFVSHEARKRDTLLARIHPNVPWANTGVGNPNQDLTGTGFTYGLIPHFEPSRFDQPNTFHFCL